MAAAIAGLHGDVLGHRQAVDKTKILVDEAQRQSFGPQVDRPAADPHLARVRPVDPSQDLYQRRLARPVLAEERVDLAGPDLEVHAVEGECAGEALGEPQRLDDREIAHARAPAGPALT